jgi:hypothetical protein
MVSVNLKKSNSLNKTFSTPSYDRKENRYFNTVFLDFLGRKSLETFFETAYFLSTRQGLSIGV